MDTLTPLLQFFLRLAKAKTVAGRRFDNRLGGGIGLNEFAILFYLSQEKTQKMRRIDLAEKMGLTASGITRLLAPMEKIGLIAREADEHDARVSNVVLASGGKRILSERIEKAELLADELVSEKNRKHIASASELLDGIGKMIIN